VTNILLDITSDESIEKVRSDVESRFSKLDVLVVGPARICTIPFLSYASEQRRHCLLS
jgi:NAD(P)-dependent dehydrogenase (short-subunit alcohol dehydrogenase family)